ncbi:tetratricopeptide repeat protein [Candidatus Sumerlaeota bacterium]|nr:tetratricopeptide repeat protein [Candidatus Sumerlaeota bacterium]
MGKLSQSGIIEQINDKIDAKVLFDKINYAPDKVQIIGTTLKCFCPLHKEKAFRSLIVDLKKNSFRCSLKGCPGFEGGTLVHFYSLHTGQPEIKSAFSLAKLLNLEIDPDMIQGLSQSFKEEAQQAFLERDIEKAQNFASQALDVDPGNLGARFLMAQALEELGNNVGAIKEFQATADGYSDLGEFNRAIEIYEMYILKREPRNEEILQKVAILYENLGDKDRAIEFYLIIASENDKKSQNDKNIPLFHKILEMNPSRNEVRLQLAQLYESIENLPMAVDQYLDVASWRRNQGDLPSALSILEHIKQTVPENFNCREQIAEIYYEQGNYEKVEQEYLQLGEIAIEQDELHTAERFYKILLEKFPQSLEGRQGLINLFEKMENRTAFSRESIGLADILESMGDLERATTVLARAKRQSPSDVYIREKLIQLLIKANLRDETVEEYFELADLYNEVGEDQTVASCLDKIKSLHPKNLKTLIRAASQFYKYDDKQKGLAEFLQLADDLQDDESFDSSISVCEEALKWEPDNISILERLLSAQTQVGLKDQALETYQKLYQIYRNADNIGKAEEALRDALTLDEKNVRIHSQLTDIYLYQNNTANALSTLTSLSQIYYENEDIDGGIETARKILELNPDSVAIRERLAYLYRENKIFDQSIEEYNLAAEYYISQNQHTAAINDLKAVLEIDENNYESVLKISNLLLEYESFEEALPYLMKGLELLKSGWGSPEDVVKEYHRILALKENQLQLREEFIAYLKSIDYKDEAFKEIRSLVDLYKEQKNFPKSAGLLEELIPLKPEDNSLKSELADMYMSMDIHQEALNYYAQAAAGYREQGEESKTIEIYRKILQIDPQEESIREELAQILASQASQSEKSSKRSKGANLKTEAIEHFLFLINKRRQEEREHENTRFYMKILDLDPEMKDIREKLAAAYEMAQDPESALEQLMILAESYKKEGDFNTAIERCKRAKTILPGNEMPRGLLLNLYEASGDTASLKNEHIALGEIWLNRLMPDKAEKHFLEAQKLDPTDIGVGEKLAEIHEAREDYEAACSQYRKVSSLYEEKGELTSAIAALRKIKLLDPYNFESREKIADLLAKVREIPESLEEYYELAVLSFEIQKPDKARLFIEKISEIAPDHFEFRLKVIQLLHNYNKADEAIEELLNLCAILLQGGRLDNLLKAVDFGLKLDETLLNLREFRIKALLGSNNIKDALDEYHIAARFAFHQEKYENAETYLNAILERKPKDLEALQQSVECALKLDKIESAVDFLMKLIPLFEKNEDFEKAIDASKRILELTPDNVEVMKQLAKFYLNASRESEAVRAFGAIADFYVSHGNYTEACTYLSRILEYDTDSIPTIRKLAFLIYENENLFKARPHFRKFLELCKSQLPPEETIKEYHNVLKVDPANPQLILEFARFLQSIEELEKAREQYLKASSLLTEDARTRGKAIQILNELMEVFPNDTDILSQLADLCVKENKPEQAFIHFNRIAGIFLERKDLKESINFYLKALRIKPDDADLILKIGELYEEMGDATKAVQQYLNLSDLNVKLNKTSQNIEIYQRILSLDESMKPVRHKLARLYEKEKRIDKATIHYLYLGRQYEEEKERNQALAVYQHIKSINPEEEENRKFMVEIYLATKRKEQAKLELEELADLYMKNQQLAEAQVHLLKVKDIAPQDIGVAEKLALLFDQQGEKELSANEYARASALYLKSDDFEKAVHVLLKAKELIPENTEYREELLKCYEKSRKNSEFLSEGMALAGLYFSFQKNKEATRICKIISAFQPSNVELRLQVANLYEANGLREQALEEYLNLCRFLLESKNFAKAGEACETGLALSPDHVPLLEAEIDVFLGLENLPKAVELFLKLAGIHHASENPTAEEQSYRKALEILPEHIPAHDGLINLLTVAGRIQEAVDQLLVLSGIHEKQNNIEAAIQKRQEILILQPENINVRDGLATLYKSQGNNNAAIQEYFTLAQMCEDDENFKGARNYYEAILQIDNRKVDAIRAIINLAQKKKDVEVFIQYSQRLADYFESVQAFADAIPLYQGIIDWDKNYLAAYQKLGFCLEAVGKIEEAVHIYKELGEQYQKQDALNAAVQYFQLVEKHRPNDWNNLKNMADLYVKLKNTDQATVYYTQTIDILRSLDNLDEALKLAQTLVKIKPNHVPSYQIFAEILETKGEDPKASEAYAYIASLLDKEKKIQEAMNARASALRLSPDLVEEREKYAANLVQLGQNDEAIFQYLQITDEYVKRQNHDNAIASARTVFKLDDANPDAHLKLKNIFMTIGNTRDALQEMGWIARDYIQKGLLQDSETILLEAVQLNPNDLSFREDLALVYQKTDQPAKATEQLLKITQQSLVDGDLNKAISSLEKAKSLAKDNIEIRKNLAELYYRNNLPEKAREELFSVANIYLEQGLIEEANKICDMMIQESPKDCSLRELIGDLFKEQEIPELAVKQYLEISFLKKTESAYEDVIKYADMSLELNPKCLEAHENRIEALLKIDRRSEAYDALLTVSEFYSDLGLFEKARDAYRMMAELAPDDPVPIQKLALVYSLMNKKDDQINALRELGDIFLRLDRTEDAVKTFRSIIDLRPDDTRARVQYIDLYSRIGPEQELVDDYIKLIDIFIKHKATAEATRIFEKLIRITPEDAEIREKFIRFLVQNNDRAKAFGEMSSLSSMYMESGELKKASRLLGEAVKIAPEDPSVHLQLAETYVMMNAKGMAVQEFKKSATLFEKIDNPAKSLEICERIIMIDPYNLEVRQTYIERLKKTDRIEDIVVHSQKLADLYIERGLLDLAENVYRDILKIQPDNIEIWNFLIQTHLQIGLEEDLVDDYLSLGDLYLSKGALKEALVQYKKVIEADPLNVEVRRKYIDTYLQIGLEHDLIDDYLELADALMNRQQIEDAIRLYSHVMSLDPDNKQARMKLSETRGQTDKPDKKGKRKKADKEEREQISLATDLPKKPVERPSLPEVSYQSAIDNYKNILSMNPANANIRCKLAEIYSKTGKMDEAVDEWDKASETFILKGELDKGISLCEKILEIKPKHAVSRDRLSKAILQRDSFKAIESAISSYADSQDKAPGENTSTEGDA